MNAYWPWAWVPIAVLTVLMVGRRWPAWKAGVVAYLSALLLARYPFRLPWTGILVAHGKAFFLWLDILIIITGAYFFFQVVREAGVFKVMASFLPRLTAYSEMQLLILGWAFTSFIQGTGGLGVPVAVVAPLLVGLGFDPMVAVVVSSVGHGWSVTFGSLGTPFRGLLAATGMEAADFALQAAWASAWLALTTGFVVLVLYRGWQAVRRLWLATLIMGTAMGLMLVFTVRVGLWPLGSMLSGMAGVVTGLVVAWWQRQGNGERMSRRDWRRLGLALSGYAVLVLAILGMLVWPPARAWLGQWVWQPHFPATLTGLGFEVPAGPGRALRPLRHPGLPLFVAAGFSFLFYRRFYDDGALRRIARTTGKQVLRVSVAVFFIVSMALVMYHAGMTTVLAHTLASWSGPGYGVLAAWLGAFGGFLTGSNLNSNVLFGALQQQTAHALDLSVSVILAAQAAGGAVGSVMAPTKVLVGASTTGLYGREGVLIRRMALAIGFLVTMLSLWTVGMLLF